MFVVYIIVYVYTHHIVFLFPICSNISHQADVLQRVTVSDICPESEWI